MEILSQSPRNGKAGLKSGRTCLYPLDYLYERAGIAPPASRQIPDEEIPQPYRTLLVHETGMTLTLEEHFGVLTLRPLHTLTRNHTYFRRVMLVREDSGRPVGMAAMRLDVEGFDPAVRERILGGGVPLGRILHDSCAAYRNRPKVYFEITPNSEMMGVFWMREPTALFGRQTEMHVCGRHIGDIVEVLADSTRLA